MHSYTQILCQKIQNTVCQEYVRIMPEEREDKILQICKISPISDIRIRSITYQLVG